MDSVSSGIHKKANFDEVVIERPDGTTQRMTQPEFFKLPLMERVKMLCDLKPRFFRGGRPVPSSEAMK